MGVASVPKFRGPQAPRCLDPTSPISSYAPVQHNYTLIKVANETQIDNAHFLYILAVEHKRHHNLGASWAERNFWSSKGCTTQNLFSLALYNYYYRRNLIISACAHGRALYAYIRECAYNAVIFEPHPVTGCLRD